MIGFDLHSSTVPSLISPVCMYSFVSFLTVPVLGFLELAVLHLLCFSWVRQMPGLLFSATSRSSEELAPSACRLSVVLLMGSLGSTKSSGHVPLPSTFSPADLWAEFAVPRDGCTQLESSGAGMGFLPPPHPLALRPHRHFPALQLLWFPSVTGPSGVTVSSSADPSKMLKDQTLCWPGELGGCGFGENGLHAYFPFLSETWHATHAHLISWKTFLGAFSFLCSKRVYSSELCMWCCRPILHGSCPLPWEERCASVCGGLRNAQPC